MYENKKVICGILARGGSKGIPRKNVRILVDKPLIKHSIDVAKQVDYIDQIFVSTDDKEIKDISIKSGAKVIDRPAELASDTAAYLDGVQHMLKSIEAEPDSIIVGLETTSPIRTALDVSHCIELFNSQLDCVISVAEVKVHPTYMFRLKNHLLVPFDQSFVVQNRQNLEKLYAYTGSILVTTAGFLQNQRTAVYGGKIQGYVIDEKSSIDIDTPLDFDICEFIMRRSK